MKIVVAIDSFKGSWSSMKAGEAAKGGIRRANPDLLVDVCPLADGGEGTVQALIHGMGSILRHITVKGPLEDSVVCSYGCVESSKTAI